MNCKEDKRLKDVYIIGSKGIPARYGGFETFVDKLTEKQQSPDINYHVACMRLRSDAGNLAPTEYHGAECFYIDVPNIGPAKAVFYDIMAFSHCIRDIKAKQSKDVIVYVLACRIGPFVGALKRKLKKLGGTLYVNPDGHEWKRAKWNAAIRKYWKYSEKLMVKHADLLICDSVNIENYIQNDYSKYEPNTCFIAYGTEEPDEAKTASTYQKFEEWCRLHNVEEKSYYLVVGRFVPENNYETMLREFMKSSTKKSFVLVTNVEQNKFYEMLRKKTGFEQDARIKFVGTVYDKELLTMIRQQAFAYFHGHEVGGTNPSLLEAMTTTPLNLLLGVGFNREVAEDGAMYWDKEEGSLASLMEQAEKLDESEIRSIARRAVARMNAEYNWSKIVREYEETFMGGGK